MASSDVTVRRLSPLNFKFQGEFGLHSASAHDELSRPVFGVLGVPVDVLDLSTLIQRIWDAVEKRSPLLISTPNVNFLMMSQVDRDFRESLLMSDICPTDGMPILWIARLLGVPIREKLSGADIFETLRATRHASRRLKVFLFGGADNVAEVLRDRLNVAPCGMECVGALNPGFGSVEELSSPHIIQAIEGSQPDFLAVFFSARKAQQWLKHNHNRLKIPVRAQLGATINVQAGTIRRAPLWLQNTGFEWLWRIKEEPYLWRRYWHDGICLSRMVVTSVLPLYISRLWTSREIPELKIDLVSDRDFETVKLAGSAVSGCVDTAILHFRKALNAKKNVQVDLSNLRTIDARFFGLLIVVRKALLREGLELKFFGESPRLIKTFRLNGFGFLLQ